MNKRYEKFINKKNSNNKKNKSINISTVPNKIGFSFINKNSKFSTRTLNFDNKYINTYRNIKQKDSYSGFFHKKNKFKLQQGMFSYKRSSNSNFSNSVESNNSIEKHNLSMTSNKVNSINSSNKNHNTLFPNLKLMLDNAEISSIKTVTNENNISSRISQWILLI